MGQMIYKILTVEADAQLQRDANLTPTGIDAADGYVHFSDASQLRRLWMRIFQAMMI